ncbi:nucleotidyltransferase domain-containing protein [Catelliglobosispora koreensis]|uniref:nucleotidyltransferase domain-containing protein n=1 Tax=Catelliglobosispora koreensis TaxID=129052 RepID=UPI0003748E0E|nr:nucleotidyltransferase domain-containing protein [Catelliglobosispora koreensis]
MFTGRKEEFIQRVREEASKDDRVRAAWLAGSYGNGTADEYSDIDLHLLLEDDSFDWVAFAAKVTPSVLAKPIPGLNGGLVITPEWVHLDIVCHTSVPELRGCLPLFDHTGLLPQELTPAQSPWGEPYFPDEVISFYYYMLGLSVVVLGRGELNLAVYGAVARLDGLIQLMLAENGVRKTDGRKRQNAYLTPDQIAFLESYPPLLHETASILAFDRRTADEVSRRGRLLAERTGQRWPHELEAATITYLRNNLDWPAMSSGAAAGLTEHDDNI